MNSHSRQSPEKPNPKSNDWIKIAAAAAIVFLACGASFIAGTQFQQRRQPVIVTQAPSDFKGYRENDNSPRGNRGKHQRGIFGNVTAVSATNITVQSQRSGITSTKTIDSSTVITNNGKKATIDSIKVGDTVMVRTTASDANIASSIDANPSMPIGRTQSTNPSSDDSILEIQTN